MSVFDTMAYVMHVCICEIPFVHVLDAVSLLIAIFVIWAVINCILGVDHCRTGDTHTHTHRNTHERACTSYVLFMYQPPGSK